MIAVPTVTPCRLAPLAMDATMEKFWGIMTDDSLPDAVMTRAVTTVASFNKFEWRTGVRPPPNLPHNLGRVQPHAACVVPWL